MNPKHGELWLIEKPYLGISIQRTNTVLVFTPALFSRFPTRIILPLYEYEAENEKSSSFVSIEPTVTNGLIIKSSIDCAHVQSIQTGMLKKKLGTISKEEIKHVRTALDHRLGIS